MADTEILRMAAEARPINDDDWGSERQVAAQNRFCIAVEGVLGSNSPEFAHWDAWCLKATTDEMIDEALRLIDGTSPYFQLPDVQALAERFAAVLREWLTEPEWIEMRRRNVAYQDNDTACASHDFCDANMAMDQAWTELSGHSFVPGDDSERPDAWFNCWNEAWNIAKARYLTADEA